MNSLPRLCTRGCTPRYLMAPFQGLICRLCATMILCSSYVLGKSCTSNRPIINCEAQILNPVSRRNHTRGCTPRYCITPCQGSEFFIAAVVDVITNKDAPGRRENRSLLLPLYRLRFSVTNLPRDKHLQLITQNLKLFSTLLKDSCESILA